ncbi:MAG: hypothetical protein DMG75_10130 [Acidobacteria bacterium]|nr:MAG: hypothetical protein DMG75_10130 [Acidobacteriota bacterium]
MGELLFRRRAAKILVVDDNQDGAALLAELLISRGYHAVPVQHAADAENEIRRDPPDLMPRIERRPCHQVDSNSDDHRPH